MSGARFRQLWRSVALSNFTDGSQKIFLPFVALSLAIAPSDVAYVFTFLTLGWPLFGLLSGVLVDRLQVRSVPFWCHLVRGVLPISQSLRYTAGWGSTISISLRSYMDCSMCYSKCRCRSWCWI
ncbi:hypothetical protein [Burkholderia lata]|uniref:hypothetical protein n=1 Tax=Burkholderia lata (strain ATCC 17760 / DSM 23089 / LMG 22485 / NCIMB 9086 / R18194 / 383) TaxID=482957 RepID=UPI000AF44373|nr:hypothetical protein [Burkholderia lata]